MPYLENGIGYVDQDTSKAAADAMKDVQTIRGYIYSLIVTRGRTCDEIESLTGMSHQSVSARIRELVMLGRVKKSGMVRKARSGRSAIVWVDKDQ